MGTNSEGTNFSHRGLEVAGKTEKQDYLEKCRSSDNRKSDHRIASRKSDSDALIREIAHLLFREKKRRWWHLQERERETEATGKENWKKNKENHRGTEGSGGEDHEHQPVNRSRMEEDGFSREQAREGSEQTIVNLRHKLNHHILCLFVMGWLVRYTRDALWDDEGGRE